VHIATKLNACHLPTNDKQQPSSADHHQLILIWTSNDLGQAKSANATEIIHTHKYELNVGSVSK
jgi:hypothetical protein